MILSLEVEASEIVKLDHGTDFLNGPSSSGELSSSHMILHVSIRSKCHEGRPFSIMEELAFSRFATLFSNLWMPVGARYHVIELKTSLMSRKHTERPIFLDRVSVRRSTIEGTSSGQ